MGLFTAELLGHNKAEAVIGEDIHHISQFLKHAVQEFCKGGGGVAGPPKPRKILHIEVLNMTEHRIPQRFFAFIVVVERGGVQPDPGGDILHGDGFIALFGKEYGGFDKDERGHAAGIFRLGQRVVFAEGGLLFFCMDYSLIGLVRSRLSG